jgi:serine/threonine protein kinase
MGIAEGLKYLHSLLIVHGDINYVRVTHFMTSCIC